MAKDDHVAVLARGAAAWSAWRAKGDEAPDLSQAAPRDLDLTGFDLSRADLRGADLAGAYLNGAQFLNCAQLIVTRNWQSAYRDETLACGATVPYRVPSK